MLLSGTERGQTPGWGQRSSLPWKQSGVRAQHYLFPLPFRRRRVWLAWMCQRDSEVATCRTMMLMESMWMEKS